MKIRDAAAALEGKESAVMKQLNRRGFHLAFHWTYAAVWVAAVLLTGFWDFAPTWVRVVIACVLGVLVPSRSDMFISKSGFEALRKGGGMPGERDSSSK